MKSKYIVFCLKVIFLFVSLTSIFTMQYLPVKEPYEFLVALPYVFFIISLLTFFCNLDFFHNIAFTIIYSGYFIRMVLTPLLFCLGEYASFYDINISKVAMNQSIFFICYEYIIVMLGGTLFLKMKKHYRIEKLQLLKYNTSITSLIIVAILFYCIFAICMVSEITDVYKPFYSTSLADATSLMWDNETIVPRGSIRRIFYSLFGFLWPTLRILMPALLIFEVVKKYGLGKRAMFYSVLMMSFPFVLISSDSAGPFFAIVIAMVMIIKIFDKKVLPLIVLGGILLSIALVVVALVKIGSIGPLDEANGIAVLAQIFNAYFPGFENTAIMLMIYNPSKLETLFFDLYYAIPFKETLFGFKGLYLQDLFVATADVGAQIMPFTAQLGHYVSMFLSPIVTLLLSMYALNCEIKFHKTDNYWKAFCYVTIFIILAASIHMYSFSIFCNSLVFDLIPIAWITCFSRERRLVAQCLDQKYK